MPAYATVHPGKILKEEFFDPLGITPLSPGAGATRACAAHERYRFPQAGISADTALRLGRYFNLPPQFWLNLQTEYDLRVAANKAELGSIVPRSA